MAMSVGKWILNKFKDIRFDRMDEHIEIIKRNTGKSKFYIKCSMVWNFLTHGTGYTDYFRGDFINLKRSEKKKLISSHLKTYGDVRTRKLFRIFHKVFVNS